jgi:3-methylcrotonyl-CoA carboxylase alpha subunit
VRRSQLAFAEPRPSAQDAVLGALWCATRETDPGALWADTTGWRLAGAAAALWRIGDERVWLERSAATGYQARVGGQEYALRVLGRTGCALEVEFAGRVRSIRILEAGQDLNLFDGGRHVQLRLALTEDALQAADVAEAGSLVTPLPGTVVAVHVRAGQSVARGAALMTIEAMKMEHTVTAPYAGIVERLPFGLADRVTEGAVLVELSPLVE